MPTKPKGKNKLMRSATSRFSFHRSSLPLASKVVFLLDEDDKQPFGRFVYARGATATGKMEKKIALPVADRMLNLISKRKAPSGFDAGSFVGNSFVDTFGRNADQSTACSTSGPDTIGHLAKRKGSSVVDSALSIMGYDSLKVCDMEGRFQVDILTSLVQANCSCGPLCNHPGGIEGPEVSLRGRMIQSHRCAQRIPVSTLLQIVENCKSFFASVKDDGTQIREVIDALVKVATDTCVFAPRSDSVGGVFKKTIYDNDPQKRKDTLWALQSVADFALEQKRTVYSKLRPSSRLRFWRIRPSCLKQDISSFAHEAMLRLLMPLDMELSQREEWAILVVCLSLAPEMFMEARRLLHYWLLSSGAVRLWELRAELVAAVWDVARHPSIWGLTNEIHLPPRCALYCEALRPFVRILEEAPTILGMLRIVKMLVDTEKIQHQPVTSTSGKRPASQSYNHVDHNSIWSLLIECLPWFLFASRFLFRDSKLIPACTESPISLEELEGLALKSEQSAHIFSQVAAKYLAWIVSPADRKQRASDEHLLLTISSSWGMVQEGFGCETSPLLSGRLEYNALKAAVQASYFECTRCGSPVDKLKSLSDEGVDGVTEAPNNSGMESLHSLQRWLANIQRVFGRSVTTAYSEGTNSEGEGVDSRMGQSPMKARNDPSEKRAYFLVHSLPLAALTESLMIADISTITSILHFVASCGGHFAHLNKQASVVDHGNKANLVSICYSCEASPRALSRESDGKSRVSTQLHTGGRSLDWLLGAAVVFSTLDSLDSDVLLLAVIDESLADFPGDRRRATDHLALVISEFVNEWGKSIETFLSEASASSDEKKVHTACLQDLHRRFSRWIAKLSLSLEATKACNDTREVLDIRIKNMKSSPLIL